ncbi:hypothetical protein COO60DRAFT_1511823 [Scenedesmus sp. NREL 46B-D3]|nr:hypothetical protein COO60DRAFT_1511823 [Scenedesmus sp. NREL 46B-D3]
MNHPGMLQQGSAAAAAAAGGGGRGAAAQALQAPAQQRMQQLPPGGGTRAAGSPPGDGDVDMAAADSVVAPIILHNEREPDLTKKKVSDFLHAHSAYELIPESGKVVLLDLDLPIRQAFHALHEQGIASAPLFDSQCGAVVGVISASDFIHTLRRLRNAVSSGSNPLSEAEMDAHTIRAMREECQLEGRPPKPLVFVRPADSLARVVRTLFSHRCSMAPILSGEPGQPSASVLHIASLSGVLTCLMRHFRASLASLPLLAQPLGALPLGTWAPDTQLPAAGAGTAAADAGGLANGAVGAKDRAAAAAAGKGGGGGGGGGGRTVAPLHAVTPGMALTSALGTLLDAGVSALPVVNEAGVLQDIYARADITKLCKGNAYNRLQWEDVTVGQALSLSNPNPAAWSQASAGSGGHLLVPDLAAQANPHLADSQLRGGAPGGGPLSGQALAGGRVALAFQDDPLRAVVERLAAPGVRRLVVVDRSSMRVQGLVSLSDVAAYLFL